MSVDLDKWQYYKFCVCDLVAVLDLPQSTVSRHLAHLRNADLVIDQRKGVWMFYRLPEELNELLAGVLSVLQSIANDVTRQPLIDNFSKNT